VPIGHARGLPAGHRRWLTPCRSVVRSRSPQPVRPPHDAACGGDDLENNASDSPSDGADRGTVVVGGQDFTESQILAAIYQRLLEDAGYQVQTKLVTTRDGYLPELSKGNVDIVPDYLAGITDYLNTEKNGPDAEPVSSNDPEETRRPSSRSRRRRHLDPPPSDATDQNAFFVSRSSPTSTT